MSDIWKNLGASSQGTRLIEELKEIQDKACDCRNWPDDVSREHAEYAAEMIEDEIIKRIQKNDPKKKHETNRDASKDQYS